MHNNTTNSTDNTLISQKHRELWIDNTKAIACILVALGHLLQSFTKSGIIKNHTFFLWFDMTIYSFHVPLFFITSGYLYSMTSNTGGIKSWKMRIGKKLLDLGVPFFVFTTLMTVAKLIFKNDVNTPAANLIDALFFKPISPLWFLYVLFFMFCITPAFQKKSTIAVWFVICFLLKLVHIFLPSATSIPYLLDKLLANLVWFTFGMLMFKFQLHCLFNKLFLIISFVAFVTISAIIDTSTHPFIYFLEGIYGCLFVLSLMKEMYRNNRQSRIFSIIVKFNMPIFLLHTTFAAFVRIVLLKIGLDRLAFHLVPGLLASYVIPCIAGWIMSQTPYLDFFFYPSKSIRSICMQTDISAGKDE